MKKLAASLFVASMFFSGFALAEAPAGVPAGTTGVCNDGTNYTGATKQGACRGHKGVKEWYGAADAAAPAAAAPAAKASAPAAPAPTAKASAPAATQSAPAKAPASAPVAAAPGGGAGMVWVNEETKVYHCQGNRWYGKTKNGKYMSAADANAQGFRAAKEKECATK